MKMKKLFIFLISMLCIGADLISQMQCYVLDTDIPEFKIECPVEELTIEDVRVLPEMMTKVVFHFEETSLGFNFDDALPSPDRDWSIKNGYDFASVVLGVLNSDSRIIDNYNAEDPLSNTSDQTEKLDFRFVWAQGREESVFFREHGTPRQTVADAINIDFSQESGLELTGFSNFGWNVTVIGNAVERIVQELVNDTFPATSYGRLILHEHGHTLNLSHTFNVNNSCNGIAFDCSQEVCDQVCHTNDGNTQGSANAWGCSPLMMGYGAVQNMLTKCELARMWNAYFQYEDSYRTIECKPEIDRERTIVGDEIWDSRHLVDGDIIVPSGSFLLIQCDVLMGTNRKIIVEQGGKLTVDGGAITNLCNDPWHGIQVYGGNSDFDVKFANDAVIENTSHAAVSMFAPEPWPAVQNFGNGILHADSTTFNNVQRIAELIAWDPSTNGSFVRNCTQNGGKHGVTNWNCLGVEVSGSTFNDISHEAIVVSTGEMVIENNTISSGVADILLTSTLPSFASQVSLNTLQGDEIGLKAFGGAYGPHQIFENQFLTGKHDIFMDGDSQYEIYKNDVTSEFGMTSIDNGNHPNKVHENTIEGSTAGLVPAGANAGYNFYENCFNTTSVDVYIEGDILDYVAKSSTEAANNCFTHQGVATNFVEDMSGSPDPFKYIEPADNATDCLDAVKAEADVNSNITIEELFDPTYPCLFSGTGNAIPSNPQAPFTPCHPIRPDKNGQNILDAIAEIEAKIREIENNPAYNSSQKRRYIAFYEQCLRKVRYYWYEVLQDERRYTELRAALAQEGTDDAAILAFASYVHEGDLPAARAYLMSWTNMSAALADFRSTQLINLERLPYGKYYQPSAATVQQVLALANRQHPYAAYAKALYYELTGVVLSSELPASLRQRTIPRSNDKSGEASFRTYPNPMTDHINISVVNGKGTYTAELYDVGGTLLLTSVLQRDTNTMQVSELVNGVYFLVVKDSTGGILYREKVVLVK